MNPKRIGLTQRPAQVRVESGKQVYFVTIWKNGSLQIRPKGSRKLDATVHVAVDQVYRATLIRHAVGTKPARRRPVSRGMIATERRSSL